MTGQRPSHHINPPQAEPVSGQVGVIGASPLIEGLFTRLLSQPALPQAQPLGLSGDRVAQLACLVLVLDRGASRHAVLRRAAEVKARHGCKVICIYDGDMAEAVQATRPIGVFFYLRATAPPGVLASAVVLASYAGTLPFGAPAPGPPDPPAPPQLTPRQREVLALLAQGLSNKAMARALVLSEPTIKLHVAALRRVFGASNRTGVLSKALRHGLIPPQVLMKSG